MYCTSTYLKLYVADRRVNELVTVSTVGGLGAGLVDTQSYICTCMHAHTHTHTHTQARTHTHTHTHMHTRPNGKGKAVHCNSPTLDGTNLNVTFPASPNLPCSGK